MSESGEGTLSHTRSHGMAKRALVAGNEALGGRCCNNPPLALARRPWRALAACALLPGGAWRAAWRARVRPGLLVQRPKKKCPLSALLAAGCVCCSSSSSTTRPQQPRTFVLPLLLPRQARRTPGAGETGATGDTASYTQTLHRCDPSSPTPGYAPFHPPSRRRGTTAEGFLQKIPHAAVCATQRTSARGRVRAGTLPGGQVGSGHVPVRQVQWPV